jgi:hypothetical protein
MNGENFEDRKLPADAVFDEPKTIIKKEEHATQIGLFDQLNNKGDNNA